MMQDVVKFKRDQFDFALLDEHPPLPRIGSTGGCGPIRMELKAALEDRDWTDANRLLNKLWWQSVEEGVAEELFKTELGCHMTLVHYFAVTCPEYGIVPLGE